MHDSDGHEDQITSAVLPDSTVERIRCTESTVFDVRVTGGFAIAVTVTLFGLGIVGENALGTYLDVVAGGDVFAGSGMGFSVAGFAAVSTVAGLALLAARVWIVRTPVRAE